MLEKTTDLLAFLEIIASSPALENVQKICVEPSSKQWNTFQEPHVDFDGYSQALENTYQIQYKEIGSNGRNHSKCQRGVKDSAAPTRNRSKCTEGHQLFVCWLVCLFVWLALFVWLLWFGFVCFVFILLRKNMEEHLS